MKKKRNIFKGIIVIVLLISLIKLTGLLDLTGGISFLEGQVNPREYNFTDDYRAYEEISSRNAAVLDRGTGEIIIGKNPYERINPASMTKIMTTIVGLEEGGSLKKRVRIDSDIIEKCHGNGLSMSGFESGDKPRLKDLLYGIMLESGAESSIALAREIGGSEEAFVELMNKKAAEIGMESSHFSNPTGMTQDGNYSTAADMAILLDYALENKDFREIVTSKNHEASWIKGPFTGHKIHNKLFEKLIFLNLNDGYIKGGKTGYTEAAGLCLASFGQVNGREYVVVTAGADGDPSTTQFNLIDSDQLYRIID